MAIEDFQRMNTRWLAAVLLCFTAVSEAQTWDEKGDAGSLPDSAQVTSGAGSLDFIDGSISSLNDADVYRIYLTGNESFSAATQESYGGNADFDTMLFLFDENGYGIYAHDDVDAEGRSRLPKNYPFTPKVPGYYYLVITSADNDPVSRVGQIFPNPEEDFAVYGPSGPGGADPISGYDNEGSESGFYHIALTGAEVANISTPKAVIPAMAASWFNPSEAGHGIMIHLMDAETAWMCWFAFDYQGNPAWICGLGDINGGTLVFDQAFVVEGGNFPPFFNPAQITESPWGSIIITFTGCDTGRMEWMTSAEGFFPGSMPLARLTTSWGYNCQ